MSDKDSKIPDFLQIKGYKYRAKMLIAAAVILAVILIIIISIAHGISSSSKESTNSSDTDKGTESEAAISYSSDTELFSDVESTAEELVSDTDEDSNSDEIFDADGKLVIDTDTLDGQKAIALTFDDGPGEYTPKLIEGLNARGARATFFMVGSCVEQYPDVLPQMVEGGHQLGNHTYNHTDITTVTSQEMGDQIAKTDTAIYQACGQLSTAFRPPYGAYNNETNKAINKTITMWSVDTMDWKLKSSDAVKNAIVSQCKDGDIILMHDIYQTTVDGALAAIDELQNKGYIFVTVEELMTRYGYDIAKGKAHASQYAVYETNSPYAQKYLDEINSQKAAKAASSAADSFYYESSQKPDNDSDTSKESSDSDSKSSFSSGRLVY